MVLVDSNNKRQGGYFSLKNHRLIKGLLFILLVLLLFLPQFFLDDASYFSPEHIKKWLTNAGVLAPAMYIIIMALSVVISPIPSLPLDLAAGAFFGPLLGTVYSLIGATGGAIITFLIARHLGRELIERIVGGHINFCTVCSDRLLTKIVLASRIIPFLSFDLISYGAGLTKMSLKRFVLATFFGMIPLTFIYNYFGSILVVGKGAAIILGFVMVILFFLLPRLIERSNVFSLREKFRH